MNNQINIQSLTEIDTKAIIMFLKNLYKENLDTLFKRFSSPTLKEEKKFIERIYNSNGVILGAKYKNNIIGILTAARYQNFQLAHSIYIGISVLKNYRNMGVGTKLMKQLEYWARDNQVKRIELEVFSNNSNAIRFYKRLGYETEGIKKDAVKIHDKFYDIVLMAKYIKVD